MYRPFQSTIVHPIFSGVRVAEFYFFFVVLSRSLFVFVLLSFFIWQLYLLSFHVRSLNTLLVSSSLG